MLFSHPDMVRVLNERFECAWEMVRPVPKVTIDFGDGRVLDRTLMGNIATYVTLADGGVIDVVPGLVDPGEYGRRLAQAERLHARIAPAAATDEGRDWARELAAAYHADGEVWDAASREAQLDELQGEQMLADARKFLVEQGIKEVLRPLHIERLRDERLRDEAQAEQALHEDTAYNVRVRNPKARALLAARPLATPAELTSLVYRDVLDVDLDDPYLGLAPYVLGGEAGRH